MKNIGYKKGIVFGIMVVILLTVPSSLATVTPNVVETLNNDNGEDKSGDMTKSFKSSNSEMLDGLSSIIMNDDELSIRIDKLEEMNIELKPVEPLPEPPIICDLLGALAIICLERCFHYLSQYLYYDMEGMEKLASICYALHVFYYGAAVQIRDLMELYGCF